MVQLFKTRLIFSRINGPIMCITEAVRQWREDMDFLYARAGTKERSERLELAYFCHENIKFISSPELTCNFPSI